MQIHSSLMPSRQTYLIIGAGVFGASTALHLKRSYPNAKVTILDRAPFPNPTAASHDLNKIVRADYDSSIYLPLAIEAMRLWNKDPIYSPWFHHTGLVFLESFGIGKRVLEEYAKIGLTSQAEMMPVSEARRRWPAFGDGMFKGADELLWSPGSGIGSAKEALNSVVQAAVDIGVEYVVTTVKSLRFDETNAVCIGAISEDGMVWDSDNTILCTGAYTEKLLIDSAPTRPELHANGRAMASAAVSCIVKVPDERRKEFEPSAMTAPPMINSLDGTNGDFLGLNASGQLKFNCHFSFTHLVPYANQMFPVSLPPQHPASSTWVQDVPVGLKKDMMRTMRSMFGDSLDGLEVENYRMCWDCYTPDSDWIISPHSHARNLFVATGGSFHSWKFLPVLGPLVVQMLQGTLDPELARTWAWNRPIPESSHGHAYVPRRDLKDIEGYQDWLAGRKQPGDDKWSKVRCE